MAHPDLQKYCPRGADLICQSLLVDELLSDELLELQPDELLLSHELVAPPPPKSPPPPDA
jgi:hypothetical protein